MKNIYVIFILFLLFLFIGCPVAQDLEDDIPVSSEMTMSFGNVTLSTSDSIYEYTINVDQIENISGYIIINAYHIFGDELKTLDKGFTFSCDDLELLYPTQNTCMIDYVGIRNLGSYTIYAKSKINSSFDKYFVLNITSNLKNISVSYKIQNSYLKDNLSYTDEMKEGTITEITKEISLCAGAIYDFIVNDKSGNNYTIKDVNIKSSSSYVFMRNLRGNSGEIVCRQMDKQSCDLDFYVGKTEVSLRVKVNLIDNSTSSIEQVALDSTKAEKVLSFVPNPVSELDRHFDYQININQVGDNNTDLLFSTDFYNWTEEAENNYLDNPYYTVSQNPNPSWLTRSVMSYVFDGEVKYNIEVDGILKTISIIPLKDTVFTSQNHGVKNLHTYIYVRYATDPANTYRWRWRIMVGGELEGIDLYIHSSSGDKEIENNLIDIREGDLVSWIFRAQYRPAVTANHRTLWYLAESDEKADYILDNGVTASLPVPTSYNSPTNKTLYFFDGKTTERTFGNLTVYYYKLDENTENGISDLWTNYGTVGIDCKLVVVNLESGYYNSVDIKNYAKQTVVLKGISQVNSSGGILISENIPKSVTSKKAVNKLESVTIDTGYPGTISVQEYPYTDRYDRCRTFFASVDSRLVLTFETNFDIESFSITSDINANDTFSPPVSFLNDNKREVKIVINTRYFDAKNDGSIDEVDKIEIKNNNPIDDTLFTVKINNYTVYVKVVVY